MNQLHNADDIHKHSDMQRTMRSTEFDFDQQTVNYYGYSYNLELPGSILRSLSAIYSNTTFSLIAQFSSTTPNCLLNIIDFLFCRTEQPRLAECRAYAHHRSKFRGSNQLNGRVAAHGSGKRAKLFLLRQLAWGLRLRSVILVLVCSNRELEVYKKE